MSSTAGWVGEYCYRHTVSVVKTQLRQVFNGQPIYIQRFFTPAEQKELDRKYRASRER